MAAWISGERGKAASLTTGSNSWESVEQLVNSWPGSNRPGMNRGNRLWKEQQLFQKILSNNNVKLPRFFIDDMFLPDETQEWAG
jgi:hypothetical protein